MSASASNWPPTLSPTSLVEFTHLAQRDAFPPAVRPPAAAAAAAAAATNAAAAAAAAAGFPPSLRAPSLRAPSPPPASAAAPPTASASAPPLPGTRTLADEVALLLHRSHATRRRAAAAVQEDVASGDAAALPPRDGLTFDAACGGACGWTLRVLDCEVDVAEVGQCGTWAASVSVVARLTWRGGCSAHEETGSGHAGWRRDGVVQGVEAEAVAPRGASEVAPTDEALLKSVPAQARGLVEAQEGVPREESLAGLRRAVLAARRKAVCSASGRLARNFYRSLPRDVREGIERELSRLPAGVRC